MSTLQELAAAVHNNAVTKGFWDGSHLSPAKDFGMRVALLHSEASELLEAFRHGDGKSEHMPEFSATEEEAADILIRLLDMADAYGWRMDEAVAAKMQFNAGRPHMHGKRF